MFGRCYDLPDEHHMAPVGTHGFQDHSVEVLSVLYHSWNDWCNHYVDLVSQHKGKFLQQVTMDEADEKQGLPLEEIAAIFGDADEVAIYQRDLDIDIATHTIVGRGEQGGSKRASVEAMHNEKHGEATSASSTET